MKKQNKGTLYIVGTPIGNLRDITIRALDTLKEVDVILAEDTRQTLKLLNHYEISKKLISYHKFNETNRINQIVEMLEEGKDLALVSDAGMPILSDPGQPLVMELIKQKISIEVVPGPTALTSAIVYSNIPTETFVFEGFLEVGSKKRKERLEKIKLEKRTMIFYEAPHKLKATLKDLEKVVGDRKVCLVREITKIYEEKKYTTVKKLLEEVEEKGIKGEIVFILEGNNEIVNIVNGSNKTNKEEVNDYIKQGFSKNDAIKKVARERGLSKNEVYMECINNDK
ncbi:MAG: 16S rRNA (cytidine(1402)-2'-O)-methyltransferase [Clostridia bacterium]|nr:16S rRNA (cytidine(1402)-2'-O)-methyltransferase [Clostridia bacterium]MDD4375367.1 16S rRNA (cytidine(1402)-2'-O)-methyltransferase [Clostridia bacterium]